MHIHHSIYITMKDNSPAEVKRQLQLGKEYLSNHPGQLSLMCCTLSKGLERHKQVSYLHNEQNWDVSFHLIFESAEAHDKYQTSDRHVKHFIPMSKDNWTELRVFDSTIRSLVAEELPE